MHCDCTEKISQLIDGELPAAEAREVERHLIDCLECRQARLDFLNLRSQIGAYSTALHPARQQQALANILSQPRIVPAAVPQAQPRRLRFSFGFSPALAAVAAMILFAVLISLALYRSMKRVTPLNPPQEARVVPAPGPKTPEAPPVSGTAKKKESVVAEAPINKRPEPPVSQAKAPKVKPNLMKETANVIQLIDVAKFKNVPEPNKVVADVAPAPVIRSADSQTLTALHLERSELLLRSFRNLKPAEAEGSAVGQSLAQFLKRPGVIIENLVPVIHELAPQCLPQEGRLVDANLPTDVRNELKSVETEIKYEGYLQQQQRAIDRLKKAEQRSIPEWFDYRSVSGLSREMQEKLTKVRPRTLGHASRIPGVTPAAVSLVNVYIEIQARRRQQTVSALA